MAVIESNNRILRAGDSPVGTRYFDGDYIHIDENNHINFTGDFSGLSAKVDECCADAHGQISAIKGSVSSLSSQFVDCCSSVNTDLTEIWNAVNANSANITNNSNNISTLSGNTALLDSIKLDISAYTEAETVPWITAWKNVSSNLTANFGDTYCFLSSIDVSGNKNHAVGVKGSYITLPTTGHIASALDSKFDTSSFNNFIENGFNPNMTELHGATSYISSFVNTGCVHNSALNYTEDDKISGISGIPLVGNGGGEAIWISGNKEIGPEILLDFGNAIQVISSFTVSGDHNHAIALKGSQFKLPSTAHISAALDDRLPISSFSSYTANADSRMDGIFQLANSAYTTAVNNYYNKADKSALSSYVPYSAIGGTTNIITGINGSALSAGLTYTAGPNIQINDNEISGKDWADDITAASSYAYEQATASIPGVQEYSAGANIDITNHVISGKDWSNEIAAAAGGITAVQSALTANFAFSSNSATYDSDGNVITATYLSSIPEGYVSSVNNLTPDIVSGGINSHELKLSGAWPTGLQLSGQDPIQVTKTDNKVVISITGDVGKSYDVIGGSNTNVATADGSAFTVSSKNWTNDITAASSYAYNQATAVAGKTYNVKAGSNINVSTAGGTAFTVSGKSWTNDITAASSYAYNQATANVQGKIYTGISPIVVDNTPTTGTISAKMAILSAESPITLESSTVGNYVVNTIKYTGDAYSPIVSAMYMTTGYPSTSIIPPVTLRQLRITTPYTYTGPSYYTAQIDGQELVMGSGAYYDFNKAVTENGIKWVVCCSGYYNLFI